MKRKFYKLIILLLILSAFSLLMLSSCSETPDEPVTDNPPSENPPIDKNPPEETPSEDNPPEDEPSEQTPIEEQINLGMTYQEIAGIIGKNAGVLGINGRKADLPGYIYSWKIEKQRLYVWFQKNTDSQSSLYGNLICNHFEFRDNLELQKGQTYDEVLSVIRTKGTLVTNTDSLYLWDTEDEHKYFVFFEEDADGVLKVSNFGNDCDVRNLTTSMPYEDVCELFQSEGTKRSIDNQVYSWSFLGGNIVAEFECTDDQLLLKRHDFVSTIDLVNLSYDEICEALGSTGELYEHEYAKGTIYRWEGNLNADLFVIFNDEMIAERFSYENDLEIKVDMTLDLAKFVLGNYKYGSNYSTWDKTPEQIAKINFNLVFETKTDFDIQFIVNVGTKKILSIMKSVPRLNINNKMHLFDVFDVLGGEGEYARGLYLWHFDNLDFIAAFDSGTGQMVTARFKECEGHEENA